jgi:2-polyprenyl-6-methoxyphenol hydroxylase-like FAD-dependent oxidoreductase
MTHRTHAIVLGGGMAGLLTARMLCDHFSRVTLIERDLLPLTAAGRKGTPQGLHTHTLLTSGQQVIERLFPGFARKLTDQGAVQFDAALRTVCVSGVRFAKARSELRLLGATRALMEGVVRERLRQLPNFRLIDQCDVLGLVGTRDEVRGVRVLRRQLQVGQILAGDLVVDATGRGSKLPRWLEELGLAAPYEQRVRIDMGYSTVLYQRTPDQLPGVPSMAIGTAAPNPRGGIAVGIEGDRWTISLFGYLGEHPPTDHDGMLDFARKLAVPDLYQLMRKLEPLSKPVQGRFPFSQRRRYESLDAFPEGLLAIGDTLCSFNPIYAQGMSAAALQVDLLDRCLVAGERRGVWRRFFADAARIIDTPWRLAVGSDLRFEAVQGARPLATRLRNKYLGYLIRGAQHDPEIALAFTRVTQLVKPPSSLFAPNVLARVLLANAADPAAVPVIERVSQVRES